VNSAQASTDISVQPLTAARWADMVELAGNRGMFSGCWCMWFRRRNADWWAAGNAGNREAFAGLVDAERTPGLLAYLDGRPVGWVSLAPRDEYERISGNHDAAEHGGPKRSVWAVVCFYIDRHHRGEGIASALLDAAIDFARASGATALEAYPVEPEQRTDNASAFTGLRSMFQRAGFSETGRFERWAAVPKASGPDASPIRRPPGRPVMRLEFTSPRRGAVRRQTLRRRSAAVPMTTSD
jgi:GNAT superfamily N-acetyltransferase